MHNLSQIAHSKIQSWQQWVVQCSQSAPIFGYWNCNWRESWSNAFHWLHCQQCVPNLDHSLHCSQSNMSGWETYHSWNVSSILVFSCYPDEIGMMSASKSVHRIFKSAPIIKIITETIWVSLEYCVAFTHRKSVSQSCLRVFTQFLHCLFIDFALIAFPHSSTSFKVCNHATGCYSNGYGGNECMEW